MPQSLVPAGSGVTLVQADCHPDVRRHYLPQYQRQVWHRHRQSNCRIVLADPPHEGGPGYGDCHRDLRLHFLPQYGYKVWHKHVGKSCRVEVYRPYEGDAPRPGGGCVQLGPLVYCQN